MMRLHTVAALGMMSVAGMMTPAAALSPEETSRLRGFEPSSLKAALEAPAPQLTRAYIPAQIDLSPLMPPPVTQVVGSCVAFSIGYALRGYFAKLETGRGDNEVLPSSAWLHSRIRNRARGPCEKTGSSAESAYAVLAGGAVSRATIGDDETCSQSAEFGGYPPDPRLRITGSTFLFQEQRDGRPSQRHLDLIKLKLAAGYPVAISLKLYRDLQHATGDNDITELDLLTDTSIYRGSTVPHGPRTTGHAMTAVGYDERRQAFLVQNSWGDRWAGNGFGWIGYDAMVADLYEASTIEAGIEPPKPRPGLSEFALKSKSVPEADYIDPCSDVRVATKRGPRYAGFVASERDRLMLTLSGANVDDVAVRPYPVCEALKTLGPLTRSPISPQIRMLGGRTDLRYGDSLAFEVLAPPVPSFLYLVYIDAEGTAVNLVPRQNVMRQQHLPGARQVFGDGGPGRLTFTASPPTGDEAIIAIAARSPIAALEALETGEMLFRMPALSAPAPTPQPAMTATRALTLTWPPEETAIPEPPPSVPADDRFYLSALRSALAVSMDESALPREIGAAVLHLTVRP